MLTFYMIQVQNSLMCLKRHPIKQRFYRISVIQDFLYHQADQGPYGKHSSQKRITVKSTKLQFNFTFAFSDTRTRIARDESSIERGNTVRTTAEKRERYTGKRRSYRTLKIMVIVTMINC